MNNLRRWLEKHLLPRWLYEAEYIHKTLMLADFCILNYIGGKGKK